MTPAERKLLRAICDLTERTSVFKTQGISWSLGPDGYAARWKTFTALQQLGYVEITDGTLAKRTSVLATGAGRQAISGGAQ